MTKLNGMRLLLRVTFVLVALLGAACLVYFCLPRAAAQAPAPTTAPVELLSVGPLKPVSQEAEQQKQMLETLILACEQAEKSAAQGDVVMTLTNWNSEADYESSMESLRRDRSEGRDVRMTISREEYLGPRVESMRWAFSGERARFEEKRSTPDHIIGAYDGTKTYVYRPAEKRGDIFWGKAYPIPAIIMPAMLTLSRDEIQSYSQLLKEHSVNIEGWQSIGGTECLKATVSFANHPDFPTQLWFSPEQGYRVKRTLSVSSDPNATGGYLVREIWRFAQFDSVWFPTEGAQSYFGIHEGGVKVWSGSIYWKTDSFTPAPAESLFGPQFPAGTRVFDNINRMPYTVGEGAGNP